MKNLLDFVFQHTNLIKVINNSSFRFYFCVLSHGLFLMSRSNAIKRKFLALRLAAKTRKLFKIIVAL